jgi:hypothetical protein
MAPRHKVDTRKFSSQKKKKMLLTTLAMILQTAAASGITKYEPVQLLSLAHSGLPGTSFSGENYEKVCNPANNDGMCALCLTAGVGLGR